jgi:hypothetical protein
MRLVTVASAETESGDARLQAPPAHRRGADSLQHAKVEQMYELGDGIAENPQAGRISPQRMRWHIGPGGQSACGRRSRMNAVPERAAPPVT